MVSNNQSFEIKLVPSSIREIEHIVDVVCDQLFINDTYYGSILMSLTEMFALLIEGQNSKTFKIDYSTDYQKINFDIYPVNKQIVSDFERPIDISILQDIETLKNVYLIHTLVDNIIISNEKTIRLEIDISALHNKIYSHREKLLNSYFNVKQGEVKVDKSDDQL